MEGTSDHDPDNPVAIKPAHRAAPMLTFRAQQAAAHDHLVAGDSLGVCEGS
jgi:hypothetical protein